MYFQSLALKTNSAYVPFTLARRPVRGKGRFTIAIDADS